MKVSALREGAAMASPPPQEMEEELVSAGSEPGAYGCRVEQGGWEDGGGGAGRGGTPPFCLGGGGQVMILLRWDGSGDGGVLRTCRMSLKGSQLLGRPFRTV